MARNVRTYLSSENSAPAPLAPKSLTKQEFGKRLYSLRVARGWSQSDLSRRADIPRDAISKYSRGINLPDPENLKKLADLFGVRPEELLPNVAEGAIAAEENPAFEMKVSTTSPTLAWVRVNRLVRTTTAVKIAELLEADDAFDRSRGGAKAAV